MIETPGGLLAAERVHLIGIGGSGMAAMAELLVKFGKQVTGSDVAESPATTRLRAAGATITLGHRAEQVGAAEVVIRSAAIGPENPELREAQSRGLLTLKLAEAAGALMRGRRGVAIAGTHGKTTTTALVAWLLEQAGLEPLALIGGESLNFGGSALAGDGPVVIEADEFDRRFLELSPEVAVVTSVEADHLDYFRDLQEIREAFQNFVHLLPAHGSLIVCRDDPGASSLRSDIHRETYGFQPESDWRLGGYEPRPGGSTFNIAHGGREWAVEWSLIGTHNARNAAAALMVADHFGVGLLSSLAALSRFRGTRRRFETKGRPRGVWVVDDYAHHPTAVEATLSAARETLAPNAGELWAIFQPHTTNRTAALIDDFAAAFGSADHALLLPIYRPSGRESAERAVTSQDVVDRIRRGGHPDARALASFDEAAQVLGQQTRPGDTVVVMGAGDVTRLADRLITELDDGPAR